MNSLLNVKDILDLTPPYQPGNISQIIFPTFLLTAPANQAISLIVFPAIVSNLYGHDLLILGDALMRKNKRIRVIHFKQQWASYNWALVLTCQNRVCMQNCPQVEGDEQDI